MKITDIVGAILVFIMALILSFGGLTGIGPYGIVLPLVGVVIGIGIIIVPRAENDPKIP